MTNRQRKSNKEKKADKAEKTFEEFCNNNDINCIKLDDSPKKIKKKYLKKPDKKCPDYFCRKGKRGIFVEIKTITNITNEIREKEIREAKDIFTFDPLLDLINPFQTLLKDTSKKFKNIKLCRRNPRILVLCGVAFDVRFLAYAIFVGAFDTYIKENGKLKYIGMKKSKRGLFDSTGSNVSALVFWYEKTSQYHGLENPKAKIPFSRTDFNAFFNK